MTRALPAFPIAKWVHHSLRLPVYIIKARVVPHYVMEAVHALLDHTHVLENERRVTVVSSHIA